MRRIYLNAWAVVIFVLAASSCARLAPKEDERAGVEPRPLTPILLAATSDGEDRVALLWQAPRETQGIAEYRLYRRKDGEAFELWKQFDPAGTGSEIQTEVLDGVTPGDLFYFNMTSLLDGEVETMPSDVLGVRVQDARNRILVVEDSHRAIGGESDAQGRIVTFYGSSLERLGRAFDSCLSEALLDGGIALGDYEYVLWTCGEDLRDSMAPEEQALVRDYLDQGANLFVCGTGIGPALAGGGSEPESREFYENYFKAYYQDNWKALRKVDRMQGAPEDRFFAKARASFGRGVRPVKRPCRLEPYGGSDTVLYYPEVRGASAAAVAYVGNFGKPNVFSRMVYLGVPWESLSTEEERTQVLQGILDYLAHSGPLKHPSIVQGVIRDARTSATLDGVEIELLGGTNYAGTPVKTMTRDDGTFRLMALSGTYHLAIEKPGYRRVVLRNVRVRQGRPFEVEVGLKPARGR